MVPTGCRYETGGSRVWGVMSQDTGIVRPIVADRTDLEDLYVRHMPGAVRVAALITGDADMAQDIAQDAFLRSVGRFRHLRQPEAFDAYLRRAVVNACTSHFRRRTVEAAYLRGQARGAASVDEPNHGRRDELRTALSALPARQRAAVVLRYYADLSEQQAGEALGCSAAAVRSMVARAMERLRERIPRSEDT
jgi:RNA polymerase sigma-70 factor (sigma-E family)